MTDWRATVATIEHRWLPARGVALQEAVFLGLFDNLLDRFDDATYSTQESSDSFHSWYHDLSAGGWARLRWSLPRGVLLRLEVGARYERHRSEDDSGGPEEGVSRVVILGAGQIEAPLTSDFRLVAALQTEGEAGLEEGGVGPSGDAMLSLRYEPGSRVPYSVGLSVARRSRIPSLRERFSDATGVAGERLPNPNLRPEVALHLGLDASVEPTPWLRVEATAFEAEVRDLIEQVYLDGFDRFENVFRARLAGVEVGLELSPRPWLDVEIAYQYLYARSLSRAGEPGPLPGRPAHQARAGLRLRPVERLEVSTVLRVVGPQRFAPSSAAGNWGVSGEADLSDPDLWGTLGAYVAWDARIEGEPRDGIRLWIQATNLLDANFQNRYGYPEPGWQLWVGTRLEI
jgi:iron complex outermembrane receptor protein